MAATHRAKRVTAVTRIPILLLGAVALAAAIFGPSSTGTRASHEGSTTLNVDGEEVVIQRDEFGVPHIFGRTSRGVFEAYGYTVAQDRLWQLELNRRAARGRLAEILGPPALPADSFARTVGYSNEEVDALFAKLNDEEQEIFTAYAAGINRYVTEVIAPDPLGKLPFEFHALEIGLPAPWTLRDSLAFAAFMVRRFGEIGGRELTNQALLSSLIAAHGQQDGFAIFNDVRWINDPEAPVTVPVEGGASRDRTQKKVPVLNRAQLMAASEKWRERPDREAVEIWERLGVPTRLGSYAWLVAPGNSAEGGAMLYGGPQMGFSTPEVVHEVQLKAGDDLNVTGMAFAGVPLVLIGRNEQIAWTSTTATGDNLDIYLETLCDDGHGYIFRRECRAFDQRIERINVRGWAVPADLPVLRSVHGPVVGRSGGFAISQKRAHWMREIESVRPFLTFNRARNLQEFQQAVEQIVTSHNFLYADRRGNIAYWQAGQVPRRPDGFDPRLPLPGDGSAEWPGGTLPIPTSINPARGWLANWNNKPSVDYDNADEQIFGKQFRLSDIDDRLAVRRLISLDDMRDIPKDIARVGSLGREARFLRTYLRDALDAVPPSHPLAADARAVLEAWDGSAATDAVTSTALESGEVIFSTWLARLRTNTFGDELRERVGEASTNMLLHVLDDALGGGSAVPPSRDYLNGVDPNVAISAAFDEALDALGFDPGAWSRVPRGDTIFSHPLIGDVGIIPRSNRATYGQIVVLREDRVHSENIFTLGQSGFIRFVPPGSFELDPHFRDLLDRFRRFEYKPMQVLVEPGGLKE